MYTWFTGETMECVWLDGCCPEWATRNAQIVAAAAAADAAAAAAAAAAATTTTAAADIHDVSAVGAIAHTAAAHELSHADATVSAAAASLSPVQQLTAHDGRTYVIHFPLPPLASFRLPPFFVSVTT